jgi:large subunit ribosomal protein L17
MRHRVKSSKLGRTSAPLKAMLRNLLTSLVVHEKIITTEKRAKAIAPLFDRLVTVIKGKDEMNAIRSLKKVLFTEEASRKMMGEMKSRFEKRSSGFTRALKIGFREGDNAPLVRLEILSDSPL